MDFKDVRDLARIRIELRQMAWDGAVDRAAASTLLDRMNDLAARDEIEHAAVEPEIDRWRSLLGLHAP